MLKLDLVSLKEVTDVSVIYYLPIYNKEFNKYVFYIDCPICKRKFGYRVKVLVIIPEALEFVKIYCPYKHIFKIKKKVINKKLLVEIQEI